jgi:hypothetical protein
LQSTIDNQQSTHPHSILTPAAAGFMLLAIAFVQGGTMDTPPD